MSAPGQGDLPMIRSKEERGEGFILYWDLNTYSSSS